MSISPPDLQPVVLGEPAVDRHLAPRVGARTGLELERVDGRRRRSSCATTVAPANRGCRRVVGRRATTVEPLTSPAAACDAGRPSTEVEPSAMPALHRGPRSVSAPRRSHRGVDRRRTGGRPRRRASSRSSSVTMVPAVRNPTPVAIATSVATKRDRLARRFLSAMRPHGQTPRASSCVRRSASAVGPFEVVDDPAVGHEDHGVGVATRRPGRG